MGALRGDGVFPGGREGDMKRRMRVLNNAIALLLVTLLYHQTSPAQVDPWERVKLIEQGKNKVVPVAKSDVARVAMVTGMSRGRKATYAGLIAGGITGGLMGAACAS